MKTLTLFDLDGTLLPIDSDHAFGEFLVQQGWVDGPTWGARNDQFYADYCAGHPGPGRLRGVRHLRLAASWAARRPRRCAERFMAERLQPEPSNRRRWTLVRQHQAAGDLVALVTATNEFVTSADCRGLWHRST